MMGIHILANFYYCKERKLLLDKNLLEEKVHNLIRKSKLKIIGKCFHKFKNAGVTGVFLLLESHVSLHTWPELNNSLNLDIFTCNTSKNNEEKAKKLFESMKTLFAPKKIELKTIMR